MAKAGDAKNWCHRITEQHLTQVLVILQHVLSTTQPHKNKQNQWL